MNPNDSPRLQKSSISKASGHGTSFTAHILPHWRVRSSGLFHGNWLLYKSWIKWWFTGGVSHPKIGCCRSSFNQELVRRIYPVGTKKGLFPGRSTKYTCFTTELINLITLLIIFHLVIKTWNRGCGSSNKRDGVTSL